MKHVLFDYEKVFEDGALIRSLRIVYVGHANAMKMFLKESVSKRQTMLNVEGAEVWAASHWKILDDDDVERVVREISDR